MTMRPAMITFDSADALRIGRWWAEQTGGQVVEENDGYFVLVAVPDAPMMAFQAVPDPTPGKNKVHLDLTAEGDLHAEVERLVAAGATVVEPRSMGDFRWVTLSDPDGNQFCVAASGADPA